MVVEAVVGEVDGDAKVAVIVDGNTSKAIFSVMVCVLVSTSFFLSVCVLCQFATVHTLSRAFLWGLARSLSLKQTIEPANDQTSERASGRLSEQMDGRFSLSLSLSLSLSVSVCVCVCSE